ncbi:MAG: response regulator [Undibacterium sp.]|nr:response regulator [Undibacterium sp.]
MSTLPSPSLFPSTPYIAIIDDDASVRSSLAMLFETQSWRFREFERAHDFLNGAIADDFNCLLVDVRIPNMSGIELFEELNRRSRSGGLYLPPVLFLSGHGDIPLVVRTLKQGAADFLEKPVDPRTLIDAINTAITNDRSARLNHEGDRKITKELSELTTREREVLAQILKGYLSKQIAAHLNISTKTVETHRLHICQKLNVHTSMELVAKLRDVSPKFWQ